MEHIRSLPLNALKCFYFVAYYGSMSHAADKLCVTHGAISKQIKKLETHLGVVLLQRQGRQLVLTAEGEQLENCCQALFNELEVALNQILTKEDNRLLVSCEPTITMRWLIPRIGQFKAKTDIDVVILAAGGTVDFVKQRIDVAIRRDDFSWPDNLTSYYLADEQIGMVESVGCLSHCKLHTQTRPNAWQDWIELMPCAAVNFENTTANQQIQPTLNGSGNSRESGKIKQRNLKQDEGSEQIKPQTINQDMNFEHFYLSLQAASAGLGQAIASRLMVQDDIDQNILAAPFGFRCDGSKYVLLIDASESHDKRKQQDIMLFKSWLQEQMAQTLLS